MENLKFEKLNTGDKYSNIPVYIFEEVSSTNIIAKGLVTGGDPCTPSCNLICNSADKTKGEIPHGTLVIADSQTAGRGRLGRSFVSPSGSGLYMSIVLRPGDALFNPMLVTVAGGIATARALNTICGIHTSIKWVNDILVNDKKLCGILAEGMMNTCSGTLDAVILGIGVNLKAPENGYPEELAGIVTNVEEVSASVHDWTTLRNRLTVEIASNVLDLLSSETSDSELISAYKSLCSTIGQRILVYKNGLSGKPIPAKAIDIDKDGGLVIQHESDDPEFPGRVETITFGEISIRTASHPQKQNIT